MDIYGLDVIEIPTNVPVARTDEDDEIYRTAKEKSRAIVADDRRLPPPRPADPRRHHVDREVGAAVGAAEGPQVHPRARPATLDEAGRQASRPARTERAQGLPDRDRRLPRRPRRKKGNGDPIPHQVLNARYHEQEAHIVAQAGVPGAVTIATNMAGRGTDIQLGGNVECRLQGLARRARPRSRRSRADEARSRRSASRLKADVADKKQKALDAGGLYVLGTERHESRRIDNQLRGRSGRQGDPGRSKFYLSLEDDLMRIFGSDRMDGGAADARPAGRRGDHPSVDEQGAREGAEEGRGAQLRHPQAHPQVRRRDERPAQGHLRAAHRHHGRARTSARPSTDLRQQVVRRAGRPAHPAEGLRRAVGHRRR